MENILQEDSLWPKPWIVVTRQIDVRVWDVCVYRHRRKDERELRERVLCQTRKLATMWHRHLVRKYRQE